MDKLNIKDNMNSSKVRRWRRTLDQLLAENGRDLKWLCDYIGSAYNEKSVSFYEKLPKKRTTYIGIGMAFKQPLDVINKWITDFAGKKRLYVKDISEDLVWIYLIKLNLEQEKRGNRADQTGNAAQAGQESQTGQADQTVLDNDINFFRKYEECQAVAHAAYSEVWEAAISESLSTAYVEVKLDKEEYDKDFNGLTHFISTNIDSFNTAYSRPREYLNNYLYSIFREEFSGENSKYNKLSSLRGYLDDAMINYLSGDYTTINTYDRKTRKRSLRIKYIPRGRKFHISLCLALGMTVGEIDQYLDMMGYAPLQEEDKTEGLLIQLLDEWDSTHPFQRAYKDMLLASGAERTQAEAASSFTANTAFQEELLFLREEMSHSFKERGMKFPYLDK